MSVKDMVYDHERRITVMSKALHCLKLEVRDLENWVREKNKIVRCKDCKYWQEPVEQDGYKYPSQCTRDERAYMEECAILMDADDFCSRGEKKDATD